MGIIMHKKDIDSIVKILLEEGWRGETYKDFEEKFGGKYSHGQIERIRARYKYVTMDYNSIDKK